MELSKIIKEHEINLKEENIVIACQDGYVEVSLEDGHLSINANFTDRVIYLANATMEDLV